MVSMRSSAVFNRAMIITGCLAVGLRNHQGRIVGRYGHAVGEGDAVGHLPKPAIGRQHSDSGAAVAIDIAAAVHDNLVPAHAGRTMQVGMGQAVEGEVGEISFPSALFVGFNSRNVVVCSSVLSPW